MSLSLHFFFPFPFLGTRIPIKFPIEFLMAFAATALMRGAHASALVCVFLSFCIQCVVARTFCVALWVHYGSPLLWTSFTQKCRQQWKVNSGWTCSGVERGVSRSSVGGLGVVFFLRGVGGWQPEVMLETVLWWQNLEEGIWPVSKRQTRSMTLQVRLEQSAPALCVDVVEIASSRKHAWWDCGINRGRGLPGCWAAREAREPSLGLNENGEHRPGLHNLPLMV